jgi:DNA-binding NtrC family response regulator/tetratricopeptide (TPR) repeat protein
MLTRVRNDLPPEPRALANAELAWAQLHRGRTREAVRTAELALRRLDPLEHGALVARLHNLVGFALYNQSEYPESIAHYERALRLREQLGDDLGVARTQNNMALSFMALGQLAEAESALIESLRRKRTAGDDLSMAASLINLGCVRIEGEDLEGTEDVAAQALEIARLRHHPETEAEALGLMGDVALARDDAATALELFERNLALCEANGHDTERLLTLRRLGGVLLRLERDDEAAERLEQARTMLDTQPSRFEGAKIDVLEAELLVRAGEVDLAVESLASAVRGFATAGRHRDQIAALIRRAELDAERGRLERVRATVAEIHELIARFDVHRPPAGLGRLETLLRDDDAGLRPLSAEACMALLLESLGQAGCGLPEAGRHAASLRTALGADRLLWIDPAGDASAAETRGWNPVDVQPKVSDPHPGEDAFERRDGFDVYGVPGGGLLLVERSPGLRAHERDLLRGAARVWQAVEALRGGDVPAAGTTDVVRAPSPEADFGLIGRSEGMRRVVQWIHRVAHTDLAVLVLGENGSGKELVAKALHDAGPRSDGPFVAINCASIPASLLESELFGHERGAFTSAHAQRVGRFEQARGGTLFLDEIGEMPPDMQAKLLRVLQERTFTRVGGSEQLSSDARIVAATNRDLRAEVERGHFRVDLYYRLNVVTIEVPPLRARLDDIEPLVRHFVARDAVAYRGGPVDVDADAIEHLRHYHWPGNVRELENSVRNALVFGQGATLRPEDFPLGSGLGAVTEGALETAIAAIADDDRWGPERPILPRVELLLVHEVVRRVGNKTRAAKLLGITKPTLYDRLRRYEALFGTVRADDR